MTELTPAQALKILKFEQVETVKEIEKANTRLQALNQLITSIADIFEIDVVVVTAKRRIPSLDAVMQLMSEEKYRGNYWALDALIEELDARDQLPICRNRTSPNSAMRQVMTRAIILYPETIYKVRTGQGNRVAYYYNHEDEALPTLLA